MLRQSKGTFNCTICNDRKQIDSQTFPDALVFLLGPKNKVDKVWTENAFSHLVWKIAAYQSRFQKDLLNPYNLLYHLHRQYMQEYDLVKTSFFQRVVEKDEMAGRHFVGVVASIKKTLNG